MPGKITIVGLGSGQIEQMTLGVWKRLKEAEHIYLRTSDHPVSALLQEENIHFESFDSVYERFPDFDSVYEAIAERLLELAVSGKELLYAVPGHPAVAEKTVKMIRQRCRERQITYEEYGGESFIDQAFTKLGFDPVEGFQLLDAFQVQGKLIQPTMHTIITQVYDTFTASEVKLALMDVYPDEYPVTVAHRLGFVDEVIEEVPLYELDRLDQYSNWSFIWVPASDDETLRLRSFDRLHEIVQILRSPDGCPWDREQTHESIRKNFIEELYEVLEAIDAGDADAMCEELGDVLLQIMLHSQMEEEEGMFNIYDVIQTLNEKLIRRHPHVFGKQSADNPEEALANWQSIKDEEKKKKGENIEQQSVLSGIPKDLPALMKAWELQKRAAKVGFDWEHIEDVLAKVDEELQEFKESLAEGAERSREELGDLLFSVVNAARKQGIDPEFALSETNKKFTTRFSHIEKKIRLKGEKMENTSLIEMDQYWEEAKKFQ